MTTKERILRSFRKEFDAIIKEEVRFIFLFNLIQQSKLTLLPKMKI